MSANCPRCAKPLEDQQLDNVAFRCCRDCRGMLILHSDLIGVLDNSWHAVPRDKIEEVSFRAPEGWQNQPALRCPDCHRTMEKYGYMGLAAIQINRCDPCAEIWLDTDELQNMVLALAKSNYRSETNWERAVREHIELPVAGGQGKDPNQQTSGAFWLNMGPGSGSMVAPALSLLNLLLQ
ncbi:MAG TPA: zf-TFIIB domain-containing protein [Verrucomicrobiae bacterium]|nr:zf-TFIIB domain-containing protein [Verrucomicrobiae bacterium]